VILKSTLAVAALAAATILSAPTVRAQQDDFSSVDPTVASVPTPQPIAPDAVMKAVQAKDPNIVLVDTQPVEGYADGHIPGAINYPWVMQIHLFPINLPRNKTLVFYGSCPHDTEDTVRQLAEYGYTNVKVMDGGWYKWVELKYPAVGKGDYAAGQATPDESSNRSAAASQSAVAQASEKSESTSAR
jgi:rhodanese-related sulfurtransferase